MKLWKTFWFYGVFRRSNACTTWITKKQRRKNYEKLLSFFVRTNVICVLYLVFLQCHVSFWFLCMTAQGFGEKNGSSLWQNLENKLMKQIAKFLKKKSLLLLLFCTTHLYVPESILKHLFASKNYYVRFTLAWSINMETLKSVYYRAKMRLRHKRRNKKISL